MHLTWIKDPPNSIEIYLSLHLLPINTETASLFHYHQRSRSLLEMATSISFKDLKYSMPHLAPDPLQMETLLLFILPSRVLAWRIPGTGEPGGLPSMGSHSQTRLMWLSSSSSRTTIYLVVQVRNRGDPWLCPFCFYSQSLCLKLTDSVFLHLPTQTFDVLFTMVTLMTKPLMPTR